jgi:hypothetical protein
MTRTTNLCDQFESDWELFSLGALDDRQTQEMTLHAEAGCLLCRSRLQQAQLALSSIGEALPEEQLSREAEARLRQRITASQPVIRIDQRSESRRMPVILPWLAAAASLALAAWFGFERTRILEELQAARRQPVVSTPIASTPSTTPPPAAVPTAPALPPPASSPAATAPDPLLLAQVADLRKKLGELTAVQAETQDQSEQLRQSLATATARAQELERNLREAQVRIAAASTPANSPPPVLLPASPPPAIDTTATAAQLAQDLARKNAELQNASRQLAELRSALLILRGSSLRQVELRPSDPEAKTASARALVSSAGVLLIARDLPKLSSGKCYQLWLIRKGNPSIVSGGLMQTDAAGGGILLAGPSANLNQLTGFAITDEPAGGSVTAQGHKLLFGAL